jgi:hypothetical protein
VPEPSTPELQEKEMRKDSKLYIQFVTQMLPPLPCVQKRNFLEGCCSENKALSFCHCKARSICTSALAYKNGYEAWLWMSSYTSSSSDGDGVKEAPTQPNFKYTSRTKDHGVMIRNSDWTVEDLNAFIPCT